MECKSFVDLFSKEAHVASLAPLFEQHKVVHLKGFVGSADALLIAALFSVKKRRTVFIVQDREEAMALHSDLKQLLPEFPHLYLFPSSYKRPYHPEEIDNANVLQRVEVLGKLFLVKPEHGLMLITYPDALSEKVVDNKLLQENSFLVSIDEKVDMEFFVETLLSLGFENNDFVYEVGAFSQRGCIIDVFSYGNEYPYRIEFEFDKIVSIRTFDPVTQLSITEVPYASIVRNLENKRELKQRISFFEHLPSDVHLWVKDYEQLISCLQEGFERADKAYQTLKANSDVHLVLEPEKIYESGAKLKDLFANRFVVEYGIRYAFKASFTHNFYFKPQYSVNKDFNLLIDKIRHLKAEGNRVFITSDIPKQLERIRSVCQQIAPDVDFEELPIAFSAGFHDVDNHLVCFTDHQIYERFHRTKGRERYSKAKSMTLNELKKLKPGDYVTHIDYGVGKFAGLQTVEVNGTMQDIIRIIYRDNDILQINVHALHKIAKYSSSEGEVPKISKLGSPEWETKKSRAKSKVKDIARELIKLYAKRKLAPGFAFAKDTYLQYELESSFMYEDTPDQVRCTQDVKKDMESPHPMDRLVCGDVGFGKTEIAIRAAFKAACDGKQVAVLVPTTILALQHFKSFSARLEKMPCRVDWISRFRTAKEVKEILEDLRLGKIDILIGTHRITSEDVVFKDLGLLVVDEEQKFGVKTKDRLKELKLNVDTLALTATPIPRTLHFSLLGARDLSVLNTPPPNRQPVETSLHTFDPELVRDAIAFELRRGGQVFFVHSRVNDIESIANLVLALVPDAKITVVHGQLESKTLEERMLEFVEGRSDILVSTNIIESGLDISNANTMIINQSHMFGLSDLHQMRGRVGRSNKKAFCYLLTPPPHSMTPEARKRLETLVEFSELGDGFNVAMRDLDIRGAGNLLGGEQSGFITDLGFETYHQILDEAVQELKQEEFHDIFGDINPEKILKTNCHIETDFEVLLPDSYISNITERLYIYTQADQIKSSDELDKFTKEIQDRFGPLPVQAKNLLSVVRLRWCAEKMGLEKVICKDGLVKAFFSNKIQEDYFQSASFQKLLGFMQIKKNQAQLKEIKDRLILQIEGVKTIDKALSIFSEISS